MSDIGQRRAEAETIVNILLVVATLQQMLDFPNDFDSSNPEFTEYFLQLIIILRASGLPNWQSHIGWLGLFTPEMTLLAMDTFNDYLRYLQQTQSVAHPLTYDRRQRLGENVWFVIFDDQSDKDFKRNARMSKKTFHSLWEAIRDNEAFHNNSGNPQEHSAYQLYTTLVRLGRRGNGMSHGEVAEKLGIKAGTSFLWTMRTLEAIHRSLGSKKCAARDHKVFNDHVKKVRVRIEHTIGYWKARFKSIKLLSPQVKSSDHHVLNMSVWIVVTALLHNWVIDHEKLEDDEIINPDDLEKIMQEEAVTSDRLDQEDIQQLTAAKRQDDGYMREAVRRPIEGMQAQGENVAYVDPELPLLG
ncbi:hypothetical protein L202_06610 [Cryptococcus amylolentus CBS 6039]|uniref:DDE Tnp4 domain-containing protein n=1 Tax=Cryptococcus amylolentus CBS 6039 TaxID=1295533 RepID=A0A1E3HGJ8_9TREE|nr:hypothetical protein L202_06610 [Cryptococcus amylolentus CBS 6039]ODN75477.1 hypothetical protein L202_06610 [Cryptococcus amylolentus CBS 6039]